MTATTKPVWKMTKAQLVDEIDALLAKKGQSVAFPSRAERLRYSKTELENECSALRTESGACEHRECFPPTEDGELVCRHCWEVVR